MQEPVGTPEAVGQFQLLLGAEWSIVDRPVDKALGENRSLCHSRSIFRVLDRKLLIDLDGRSLEYPDFTLLQSIGAVIVRGPKILLYECALGVNIPITVNKYSTPDDNVVCAGDLGEVGGVGA